MDELQTPLIASKKYFDIISHNLSVLIDLGSYSENQLSKKLEEYGLRVNQGTISKYIHGGGNMHLSVAIALCEIYNISLSDLVSENFTYDNYSTAVSTFKDKKSEPNEFAHKVGKKFIVDPKDEHFEGYIQKYYCYFFPTISKENQLLVGELELREESTYCAAFFSLNTNKKKCGENIYKHYSGYVIISKAVESCYIILSSEKEGEICLINLRYFSIRHQNLDCRMAEVITNGAGERHFPTIHRMLLSREKISCNHLKYISPHLHLNSSDIRIKKEYLEKLESKSDAYKELIEHLLHRVKKTEIYDFKEDYIISNAKQFLSKDEARYFLSNIRDNSYKMRYNKVSNKLDETVRELLLSFGYYSDNSPEGNIK